MPKHSENANGSLGSPGEGSLNPGDAPTSLFYHELSLNLDQVRNPEIRNFFDHHNFLPYYWREITIANKHLGLAGALHQARYANNNADNPIENQIRAAENTYERAETYVGASQNISDTLRLAFPEGQTLPSPQEIKSNPEILETIATFILAFRKVEAETWPAWNAGVLASAQEQIKARLMTVSDDEAIALWDMVRNSNNERLKFWTNQFIFVKDNMIVKEILALRDARDKAEEPSESEQVTPASAEEPQAADRIINVDEKPLWETYVPPNGQFRIEGTDVPVVTDGPVAPALKKEPAKPSQTEALFNATKPSAEAKAAHRKHERRPYRARYSDTTDHSVKALRQGLEPVTEGPDSNPDADLDEIFGRAASS